MIQGLSGSSPSPLMQPSSAGTNNGRVTVTLASFPLRHEPRPPLVTRMIQT